MLKREAIITIMTFRILHLAIAVLLSVLANILPPQFAHSSPKHGLAMYGEPALPKGFTSLPMQTQKLQKVEPSPYPKLEATTPLILTF